MTSECYLFYLRYWMKTRNKKHERYDFSLSPVGDHFMFWEYLQAGGCQPEIRYHVGNIFFYNTK